MAQEIHDGKSILIDGLLAMNTLEAIDILAIRRYHMFVTDPYEDYDNFIPLLITFDPILDMWSYTVGNQSGVADTKTELVHKVWNLVREWEENERT